MAVTLTDSVVAPVPPPRVFGLVDDLSRYPEWTDLVSRAVPVDAEPDGTPAWEIDLRGRVGRLARSKRLRMVRSVHDAPGHVTFERREPDGDHSPWRLDVVVEPAATDDGAGSLVTVTFEYGGGLWGPVIERLLRDGIDRSKPRFVELTGEG